MIFIAKNEDDIPSWKLAVDGKKTVTRRVKPIVVGKTFAIQPGRGKFAICRARVTTVCLSMDHYQKYAWDTGNIFDYKNSEAKLEGFNSWDGLMKFLQDKNIQFKDTFRIEFEVINNQGDL